MGGRVGRVGALHGYRHAMTVVRAVRPRTLYVPAVGDGAGRLALEIGLEEEDLSIPDVVPIWRKNVSDRVNPSGTPSIASS